MYYCVAPRTVSRHRTLSAALDRAAYWDRAAKDRYGPQAGADCWVVRSGPGRQLAVLGLAARDSIIGPPEGREFGAADSVRCRVREYLARRQSVPAATHD